MAQTEHLGLHQWEATDSFLRTDFNEDFQKIDGAVGEAAQMVKLSETLTRSQLRELTVDLSGIDWNAYRRYEIYFTGSSTGGAGYPADVYIRLNGKNGAEDYAAQSYMGNRIDRDYLAYASLPGGGAAGGVCITFYGGVGGISGSYRSLVPDSLDGTVFYMSSSTGVAPDTLLTLNLTADESGRSIAAGARVTIYGVGK